MIGARSKLLFEVIILYGQIVSEMCMPKGKLYKVVSLDFKAGENCQVNASLEFISEKLWTRLYWDNDSEYSETNRLIAIEGYNMFYITTKQAYNGSSHELQETNFITVIF